MKECSLKKLVLHGVIYFAAGLLIEAPCCDFSNVETNQIPFHQGALSSIKLSLGTMRIMGAWVIYHITNSFPSAFSTIASILNSHLLSTFSFI
jgi:hypothetical protein